MNAKEMSQLWQEQSQKEFEALALWRVEHPEATLAEIEAEMDRHLHRVRAAVLEQAAQASEPVHQPLSQSSCPHCGAGLQARGTHARTLETTGGASITLQRHYQSCPQCGRGFFPPG